MEMTEMSDKSEEAGFLAVFPNAIRPFPSKLVNFRPNPQVWNDGSGRGYSGKRDVDDVGFIDTMIDDLSIWFSVDPQRIYVTGFSNGASMSFRLGVELSESIAGIAPVAGYFWLENPTETSCLHALHNRHRRPFESH
jgi:polyhydroxybutyrate depolymerase